MWSVAAQPRVGLTPMIPTPSFDSPAVIFPKPPASRGQNHDGLDGACLCCVLCSSDDLIERILADEAIERDPALFVLVEEAWKEVSRVACALLCRHPGQSV